MILKSFFALALTVSAFVTIAQDGDGRTEIPETCLNFPTTLSVDAPQKFLFKIDFECQVFNYHLSVYNSEGERVFESNDPKVSWNAADAPGGDYVWRLKGAMGTSIEYQDVKKEGHVTILK